ncbi:MAG TPA: DNA polymerase I [Gemmatimonadales bacterium]|nr:DNA polymerase I [Gemmatimonadales bacterium]
MPHDPPQLFLIDGYALIYRAFFALISRPLRTSRGENTSAAWGVVNFLLRLRSRYQPDYVVWVNDAGDSFRTDTYPEYKSTREKLDDQMQADFDLALLQIDDLLSAFDIPVVTVPGYEADDVIGTLATHAAAAGLQAVIVSGDKDLYQLIRPGVALLNPGRGGPAGVEEQWVDESNAAERLGVPPSRVVDYLALVGDSSDNIPGVRGIGDKGARQLLAEYDDLDTLLARAAEVPQKRAREALLAHADAARLSRELVTIKTDVPVTVDLGALKAHEPDRQALLSVLTRLEFHSLVKRLAGETAPGDAAPEDTRSGSEDTALSLDLTPAPPAVTVVSDAAAVPAVAAELRAAPAVSLRSWVGEGEPRTAPLVGLALGAAPDRLWYLPLRHETAEGALAAPEPVTVLPPLTDPAMAPIAAVLADPTVRKVGHDLKAEVEALRNGGVGLQGLHDDVMLMSFVVDPGRRSHGLDTLAMDHLGQTLADRTDLTGKGKGALTAAQVTPADAAGHCGAALQTIMELAARLGSALGGAGLEGLYRDIELPLIPVLADMEWAGIAIDPGLFRRMSRQLAADLEKLEGRIAELAGTEFNLNSPKQMAAVLFEKLQLPVLKKTKTGPSTDADVLDQLAQMGHEVPTLILEHRELQKLRSTYVDVLPARVNAVTGRIHTSFNQTGAATGRLSSSDPNLQNIPVRTARGEEIRRGFVPTAGWSFVVADYSQIELRLLAHFSGDPSFVEAFSRGGDIHRQTAAIIFGVPVEEVTGEMRARAKTINFATIYGQGPFALARQLGITQDEARAFIAQYFERFAGVRAWLDGQVELARSQGWVETLFRRRRYVPEIREKNFNIRSFGERLAQNSPLQGSAADLIKVAMIRVHDALAEQGMAARMLLQVHDELVLEAPPPEVEAVRKLVRAHMEGAAGLRVPLVVDVGVGPNWLEAKQ